MCVIRVTGYSRSYAGHPDRVHMQCWGTLTLKGVGHAGTHPGWSEAIIK